MQKLLIKLFIKNYNNVDDPIVRKRYGILASIFGIITNVFISLLKIIIGILFGLISFIGDGLNNLLDSLSSIISFIGFKISLKPADKDHPFGHARMEYISGFIISLLMGVLGAQLILSSIENIIEGKTLKYDLNEFILLIIVLVISIFVKLYQCIFYLSISKKIKSLTLKSTAIDSLNDIIATFSILVGTIVSYFAKVNLDGYLGVAIGIFIAISAIRLIFENANPLLGQNPDKNLVHSIVNIINQYPKILGIHDLQIHSYGHDDHFASIHVELDSNMTLLEAHTYIDKIEEEIYEKTRIKIVIHIDPIIVDDDERKFIETNLKTIISSMNYNIKYHDLRIIKGITHTMILFDIVIPENKNLNSNNCINYINTKMKEISPKYILDIKIDKDFQDLLNDYDEA